jgi:hypothetical protein
LLLRAAAYCPAGATTACGSVLVVGAPYVGVTRDGLAEVQSTLQGTGAFATVDTFNAYYDTPSAALLAGYDAVLAFSSDLFADASLLGDRLAAYHDQGGGVVIAFRANSADRRLQGAYGAVANGYALMDYATGGDIAPSGSLGEVVEPQSPLMAGVTSLAAQHAHRSTATVVAGRGVVVARWAGGGEEPLVLRGTRGNRTLVELNFWPGSIRAWPNWWTGDGGELLRNGLKYSRCMPCGMGTYAGAGEKGEGGGWGWGLQI